MEGRSVISQKYTGSYECTKGPAPWTLPSGGSCREPLGVLPLRPCPLGVLVESLWGHYPENPTGGSCGEPFQALPREPCPPWRLLWRAEIHVLDENIFVMVWPLLLPFLSLFSFSPLVPLSIHLWPCLTPSACPPPPSTPTPRHTHTTMLHPLLD